MKDRPRKQTAFALMLVMLMMAMAVVLGLGYLSAASLKVNGSDNYVASAKARYMAESGMEHAMWLVQANPSALPALTGTPLGPFYVDATSDAYYFYGQNMGSGTYRIIARGASGALTQETEAYVARSPSPIYLLKRGMMMSSAAWLPSGLTVNGDVQINGTLVNSATVTGRAISTGAITDTLHRILGGTRQNAAAETAPALGVNDYRAYNLYDSQYNSIASMTQTLAGSSTLANGAVVTPSNPGGVVEFKANQHTITLSGNLNFTGTMIIDGDVILNGANIKLTAVNGFPAIVCNRLIVNYGSSVTINGTVLANQGVVPGSILGWNSTTTINGSVVGGAGYDPNLLGRHTVTYKTNRSQLYNVANNTNGQYQVQLESWVR